jgi:hypothetical protein
MLSSKAEKGSAFERLTQLYLQTAPEYRTKLQHVWLLREVPTDIRGRSGDSGVLKVAASLVQIEAVFSTFLHQYARRYPKVEVRVFEAVGPDGQNCKSDNRVPRNANVRILADPQPLSYRRPRCPNN